MKKILYKKKCFISYKFLMVLFLTSMIGIAIGTINKSFTPLSSAHINNLRTNDLDSADTTDPVIDNVQVSDPLLELTDAQTITCDIYDDSGISDAKVFIQFPDTNTIATREMVHAAGNTYQAIWSSIDASLGDYYIDILAIDNSENLNSNYENNIITFSIIEKTHRNVISVSPFRTTVPSLSNQLKYDDQITYNVHKELYYNKEFNGKSAIAFPSVFKSYQAAYYWSEHTDYNELTLEWWNQYAGDGKVRQFFYDGFIWTTSNIVDDYITIKSHSSAYDNCYLKDIDINMRLRYTTDGTGKMQLLIHNFANAKDEVIVDDQTNWGNSNYVNYHVGSSNLPDSNLYHYLDPYGQLKFTIRYYCLARVYWWFPKLYVCRIFGSVDRLTADVTWIPNDAKIGFNFDSGLLNGINDFYIYFQGKTTEGTATIKVNDQSIATFSTNEITIGVSECNIINDVSKLTIEMGTALEIQIDFLYTKLIRDYPYDDIISVNRQYTTSPILENQLKSDDGIKYMISKSIYSDDLQVLEENFNYYFVYDVSYVSIGNIEEGAANKDDDVTYCQAANGIDLEHYGVILYQEISFNLGSDWKENNFLQEITILYDVGWTSDGTSSLGTASQLEIWNIIANEWELWKWNLWTAGDHLKGEIVWNDGYQIFNNNESFDNFNNKYITNEGNITFRFAELSTDPWYGGYMELYWDFLLFQLKYYDVDQFYQTEIEFIFESGVLDGEKDYYLWLQAGTDIGTAGFYVNGVEQFEITSDYELTLGPVFIFIITNGLSINIKLEDANYIDIDYLYLQLI